MRGKNPYKSTLLWFENRFVYNMQEKLVLIFGYVLVHIISIIPYPQNNKMWFYCYNRGLMSEKTYYVCFTLQLIYLVNKVKIIFPVDRLLFKVIKIQKQTCGKEIYY